MASFSAQLHLDRLEDAIALFCAALEQPSVLPIRVLSSNMEGVVAMEILHSDLPFGSPFLYKTSIFDHPDILLVEL
jgi:hypothetical protein